MNKEAAGAVDVTLIEPLKNFTTCFFSNLYVGGFRDRKSLTHNYDKVRKSGVNVVHVMAGSIDRDKKTVMLAGGARVPYDRLVIAPGIDLWDSVRAIPKQPRRSCRTPETGRVTNCWSRSSTRSRTEPDRQVAQSIHCPPAL